MLRLIQSFCQLHQLQLLVFFLFVVETFGCFLQQVLNHFFIRHWLKIRLHRRNGDAFEITFDILVRKHHAARRIDVELNSGNKIFGIVIAKVGLHISQHKLFRNVDGFFRDIKQFAKDEVRMPQVSWFPRLLSNTF